MSRCAPLLLAFALLGAPACTAPLIVDCSPGRFVQVGDEAWCAYPTSVGRCPTTLPELYSFDSGGSACSRTRVEAVPPVVICTASQSCGDAG